MKNQKIAVTGAGGFIGSRVSKLLIEEGYNVELIDNFSNSQLDSIKGEKISDLDIRDREELKTTLENVDQILHLAAISGVPDCVEDPEKAVDTNIKGTINIAEICMERNIPLVHASSMAVVGNTEETIGSETERKAVNLYGKTKAVAEETVEQLSRNSFPAHIYRKSNVYGSHKIDSNKITQGNVITKFIEQAEKEEPITVYRPGSQARDFIHVKDLAETYLRSVKKLEDAENSPATYSIASGEYYSVKQIAEKVQKIFKEERGYRPEIELVDNPREGETLQKEFKVDVEKTRKDLKLQNSVDIEDSIQEEINSIS